MSPELVKKNQLNFGGCMSTTKFIYLNINNLFTLQEDGARGLKF